MEKMEDNKVFTEEIQRNLKPKAVDAAVKANKLPKETNRLSGPTLYKYGKPTVDDKVNFIYGVSDTLADLSRSSGYSSFTTIERISTCLSLLLRLCETNENASNAITYIAKEIIVEVTTAISEIQSAEQDVPNHLCQNGLPDLFYLPLRVTQVLGWSCAAIALVDFLSLEELELKEKIRNFINELLERYPAAFVAMSDKQTPYLMTFFSVAIKNEWKEEVEIIFGMFFNSLHSIKGDIACSAISSSKVLEYIQKRSSNDLETAYEITAHPSELLPLLLLVASKLGLEGVTDQYLSDFDHIAFNIYIPDEYKNFNQEVIKGGTNHSFAIGQRVFKCSDLLTRWEEYCLPQLSTIVDSDSPALKVGVLCSALLYPDRSPWFLLADT